jgi:hypothetical protein
MLEKKPFSTDEQKRVDEMLTGLREKLGIAQLTLTAAKARSVPEAVASIVTEYLLGIPADASLQASQNVMQNSLSEYVNAMGKAADQKSSSAARAEADRKASEAAARDADRRAREAREDRPQPPPQTPRDATPQPTARTGLGLLRAGPNGLRQTVSVTCHMWGNRDSFTLYPGGSVTWERQSRSVPGSCTNGVWQIGSADSADDVHIWCDRFLFSNGLRSQEQGYGFPLSGRGPNQECR